MFVTAQQLHLEVKLLFVSFIETLIFTEQPFKTDYLFTLSFQLKYVTLTQRKYIFLIY